MITKHQFLTFIQIYQDRYGTKKMDKPTIRMWYDQLNHLEWDKFEKVYQKLIGAKEWPFGWGDVIAHHELMFPPENPVLAQRDEWKNKANEDKRKELKGAYVESRKSGQNWIKEYAQKTVQIFGEKEAQRICMTMGVVPEQQAFKREIMLVLRGD